MPLIVQNLRTIVRQHPFVGEQLRAFYVAPRFRRATSDKIITVSFLGADMLRATFTELEEAIRNDAGDVKTLVEVVYFAVDHQERELGRLSWNREPGQRLADIFATVDPDATSYLCLVTRTFWHNIQQDQFQGDYWELWIDVQIPPPRGLRDVIKEAT